MPRGLADTSKTKIKLDTQTPDKRSATGYKQIEKEVHKVQIHDPATGTGTFFSKSFVFELKALQKSIKFTPCWPSAGPTGGLGLAAPAGTWSLI